MGRYSVEPTANRIVGRGQEIQVEPRVMEVLVCLMRSPGRTMTHDDLLEVVWSGVIVEESAVRRAVSQLRKAFDDDASAPRYIETIRKTGYRLIAPVTPLSGDEVTISTVVSEHRPTGRVVRHWWGAALALGLGCAAGVAAFGELRSSVEPLPMQPLTATPGIELRPQLSPDGAYVAYVADDGKPGMDLYLRHISDTESLQLTSTQEIEMAPTWSPDGRRLAFLRFNADNRAECGIYLISLLGTDEHKLADCGGAARPDLAWSPDGQTLAHSVREDATGSYRIVLLDVETLERRFLTTPPASIRGDIYPAFSSDGKKISFIRVVRNRMHDLYAVDIESGDVSRLTHDGALIAGHDWSDDGSLIMSSNRDGRFRFWRVHKGGGDPTWLSHVAAYDPGSPSVSAAGDRLVYEEWSFDFNIWRQELNGARAEGAPRPAAPSTRWDLNPQFSPDGGRIAFTSNRSGSHDLWIDEGGRARKVTSYPDGYVSSPRWSPDGRRLAFELCSGGPPGIYVIDANGGSARLLAEGGVAPSWSRDGLSIYYALRTAGSWDVWKRPLEGRGAERVVENGFAAQESFDGMSLLFTRHGEPGLWQRPFAGGVEKRILDTLDPVDAENWVATQNGIYFVDRLSDGDRILFLDYSGEPHLVLRTSAPVPPGKASLSVSADESALLFGQTDERNSDLVLVEGVR